MAAVHAELVQLARTLVSGERDAPDGLSFAQHSLLSFVARRPGCRATDISDAFAVHRSTVSRQLRSCVDSGWVRAEPNPSRSGYPLSLTERGAAVLASADRRRLDEVRARTRGWSPDEIALFADVLRRFREAPTVAGAAARNGDDSHA